MALLQNLTLQAQYPGRQRGGSTTATADVSKRTTLGARLNGHLSMFTGSAWADGSSFPTGWIYGNGWLPPMKAGATWRASLGKAGVSGSHSATFANLAGGLNAAAPLSGGGDLAATLSLLAGTIANLSGSGELTANVRGGLTFSVALAGQGDVAGAISALSVIAAALEGAGDISADLLAALNASADISGAGTLVGIGSLAAYIAAALEGSGELDATIKGKLEAIAALSGSGDLEGAVDALASMVAELAGEGTVSAATPYAQGSMSASITSTGELLTSANVADAVWGALVEAGITNKDALRLILAVITGDSEGFPLSPKFKSPDGTKDRVTADVDADGNRSNVVLDPS